MAGVNQIASGAVRSGRNTLEGYGDQFLFYVKALAWAPRAIKRYPREVWNTLAEVTFGVGGLSVIAGSAGVIAFMSFFAGTQVGIQGYASLSQIGVAKFSAFISAYFNTREVAPLVSAIALAATVGCGYTARLGAMRI
jgi:phospholipid/cholesterol/gamma-HCH transport system permease protein